MGFGTHTKETVLVVNAAAKCSIPVVESCAAMGLRVIAASDKKYCCGFYCRGTRERIVYPSPDENAEECVKFVVNILKQRRISVMFPLGHFMTDFIAKHQDEFRKYTRLVLPSYDIFFQGLSKIPTLKAAARVGCPIPQSWYPQDQPLDQIAKEVSYPVLVKPTIGVGARGITFCHSSQELFSKCEVITAAFGDSFVQELVPQTGTQYKTAFILDYSQ